MSDAAWAQALEAFDEGEVEAAEAILRAAIAAADTDAARAEAWFNLASLFAAMGDHRAGADALREAIALDIPGAQGQRDRLTWLMNLGEFLTRAELLDDAEAALLEGLEGRREIYGEDHPGYAFGLEPLADLRLLQGDGEAALGLYDQCLQIFWEAGHPRVTTALAGRAFALAALDAAPLLEPVDHLPDALMGEVIDALIERIATFGGQRALGVLDATLALAEARCAPAIRRVRAAEANLARGLGATARRIAALTALEGLARSPGERIDVLQGLAMAHDEAGDHPRAEQAYVQAVAAAEELDDPGFSSRAQRNAGLYLADHGRRPEARRLLATAVDVARGADLMPELGRALIALGIFDQHDGDLEPAEAALREGITLLPPDDADRLSGVSHLGALEAGGGCGCGDMSAAISEALVEMVRPHLPDGLLEDLTVTLTEEGPSVAVQLAREASQTERAQLNRLIERGLARLRSED